MHGYCHLDRLVVIINWDILFNVFSVFYTITAIKDNFVTIISISDFFYERDFRSQEIIGIASCHFRRLSICRRNKCNFILVAPYIYVLFYFCDIAIPLQNSNSSINVVFEAYQNTFLWLDSMSNSIRQPEVFILSF